MSGHELPGPGGAITISPAVLSQVVIQAAELADGVRVRRPRRGVEIEVADGHARVELELSARYGAVLPELGRKVQERVAGALQGMCGLVVDAVDLSVEELVD